MIKYIYKTWPLFLCVLPLKLSIKSRGHDKKKGQYRVIVLAVAICLVLQEKKSKSNSGKKTLLLKCSEKNIIQAFHHYLIRQLILFSFSFFKAESK